MSTRTRFGIFMAPLASGLTAAFVVAGMAAWRSLRASDDAVALRALHAGVRIAAVLAPLQILAGDLHGLNTLLEHQPAKIAAIEGPWHTERGAPLVLRPTTGRRSPQPRPSCRNRH